MTEEVRPVQGDPATADHIAGGGDAHDASAISVLDTAANFTGTDVEAVLAELSDDIAAGGIPATIVDAKGDLIVATAADTVARLAVGANTLVLTADSAETTGLKWAAGGGGLTVSDLLNSTKGSADTPDDEFAGASGSALDGKWTVVDGTNGAVALLAAAGAGLYRIGQRAGWLLAQVGTVSGDSVVLRQDYTLPDGKCIVGALSFALDMAAAVANNEMALGIGVNDNDTSVDSSTAAQTAQLFLDADSGGSRIIGWDGAAVIGQSFATNQVSMLDMFYFRIDRSGLVYTLFWSRDGFSWSYIGAKTMGTAANNLWLFAECRATMANRIVVGCPWFREGTALAVDPWPL